MVLVPPHELIHDEQVVFEGGVAETASTRSQHTAAVRMRVIISTRSSHICGLMGSGAPITLQRIPSRPAAQAGSSRRPAGAIMIQEPLSGATVPAQRLTGRTAASVAEGRQENRSRSSTAAVTSALLCCVISGLSDPPNGNVSGLGQCDDSAKTHTAVGTVHFFDL